MNKKMIMIGAAIILALVIAVYFSNSKELHGNNPESIAQSINAFEGYGDKQIEILEIDDYKDARRVGFLSDNIPSYAEFNKEENGNYLLVGVDQIEGRTLSMFDPLTEESKMMIVTNLENEIARMQVEINGQLYEQTFTPNEASVTWLDYPQTNENSYEFRNFNYFDEEGNLVESYRASE